jgi:predicted transcriptional regulator of viral defense system
MTNCIQELKKKFKENNGVMRFSAVLKAGFHSDTMAVMEKRGEIIKIGKGLFRLRGYGTGPYPDFLDASLQSPSGVICLVSALYFHEVTAEIPSRVDIAIRAGAWANRIKYPPVRFYRFSPDSWNAGIEKHEMEKQEVRVYNLAKTVADCFKFRNKLGADTARAALKTAVLEKGVKTAEIMKYAKICRVDKIIKPALEAII